MLAILVAAFLVANPSFAIETEPDFDSDIYDPAESPSSAFQRRDKVCYDDLGCFEKNGTFKYLRKLPDPPETIDTKFLLYTKKNPDEPQFIDYNNSETIENSNINPKSPLVIVTTGFGGLGNNSWLWEMKNALVEMEDANVIIIEWTAGGPKPYYITATVNSELIGAQTAVLYYKIKDIFGIMEKDLHLIGYSLGAHLIGFTGKRMKQMRGTRPGRLTGLDPASLLFEDHGDEVHLSKDDADFVDVIHTNADRMIYGGVGMEKPIGHVDFYPNGGQRQPGCKSTIRGALWDIFKGEAERDCNHERAVHFFTDSILNPDSCQYIGYPCRNYTEFQLGNCLSCDNRTCGQMGYRTKGSGVYYLLTKPQKPFCGDAGKLTVRYSSTIKKSYGWMILTLVGKNGEKENITLSQKDDKLIPGKEKVLVFPINEAFKELSKVTALYMRYNGWFTTGTETFGLASVTILDSKGDYIFKTCGQDIILKDKEYQELNETTVTC